MITNTKKTYMDINLDRGAGYGDILICNDKVKPDLDVQMVNAQMDVDEKKFDDFFVKLMSGPTPGAHNPLMLKDCGTEKIRQGRINFYYRSTALAKILVVGSLNMDLVAISPRIPVVGETIIGNILFHRAWRKRGQSGLCGSTSRRRGRHAGTDRKRRFRAADAQEFGGCRLRCQRPGYGTGRRAVSR